MLAIKKGSQRFTLLLLEENESYLANWMAHCTWPLKGESTFQADDRIAGTLRLGSKSLFFEPDDVRLPIARLPFAHTTRLEGEAKGSFVMVCSLMTKMKANMADAPYVTHKEVSTWHFQLAYAGLVSFLPLAHQCLVACKLPYAEREAALAAIAQSQARECVFDTSRLVDFGERMQLNTPAEQLTPLVREGGRLLVTDQRLYFQPLHDIAGNAPVRWRDLASVAAVAKRRSSLRHTGMEVFFLDPCPLEGSSSVAHDSNSAGFGGTPSIFFAFATQQERDHAVAVLSQQPLLGSGLEGGFEATGPRALVLEGQPDSLHNATLAWQRGVITNFDYLLFCNLAAGRSFNDLAQWPVFPWILSDYKSSTLDLGDESSFRDLSKPVGALNQQRLELMRGRYRDMEGGPDPPFMYGTHYSCPGYIMYWLVRAAPAHLLRLQNGKFDAPDRMFLSVGDSWGSVTSMAADVKELIPEFFLPNARFLRNEDRLALGSRQSGKMVGDVELPPWCSGPPDFLQLHRAALESPPVSATLHHWLDLIFGYKQSGAEALAADNVFHHLTYEGAVDVESITDSHTRLAMEAQINEFGQCPRQLFATPHPPRVSVPSVAEAQRISAAAMEAGRERAKGGTSADASCIAISLALLSTIASMSTEPVPLFGGRAEHEAPPIPQMTQASEVSSTPASAPASEPAPSPNSAPHQQADSSSPEPTTSSSTMTSSSPPLPPATSRPDLRVPERMRNWSGKLGAGHNGSLKVFEMESGSQVRAAKLGAVPLTSLALLDTPVSTSGDSASNPNGCAHVLVGSYDNRVYSHSPQERKLQGSWEAHDDAVSCLSVPSQTGDVVVSASWDCSVRLWSLAEARAPWLSGSPTPLSEIQDHDAGIWAMAVNGRGSIVATGTEEGAVCVWDTRNSTSACQVSVSQECVRGLAFTPSETLLVVAVSDGRLCLLDMRKQGASLASVALGVPARCCLADDGLAVAGTAVGQVQLWDIAHQQGQAVHTQGTAALPSQSGMHTPLAWGAVQSPINGLWAGASGSAGNCLVTAHEDGSVRWM
ncbi:hypothetical protein WJX73_005585 [Symbiochloris irregularis]|uniref:Protein FAN n=1 Tax=Symbiochloris irregularis TaxID=706552 RepID=A0AAW1P0U5_9CHLO